MGKLGSRFLFIEMPSDEQTRRRACARRCRRRSRTGIGSSSASEAVADFLDDLWRDTGGVRGVTWKRDADPEEVMLRIAAFAKVLARLRGTSRSGARARATTSRTTSRRPMIEGPQRAMCLLYALARGHALVHGRRQLTVEDLPIVARAALESTPNDRRAVMRILLANDGVATTTRRPGGAALLGADRAGDPGDARQARDRPSGQSRAA